MICWCPMISGDERIQEQHQGQKGSIWTDTVIFQPYVCLSLNGGNPAVQAVSHGNNIMYICICNLSFGLFYINPL